ncbi:MAG: hypothetical protein FWG08_01180 [Propionibacteriaceae bacterium]|nr:hypothetical protein [Propionibacteriaceae bacterium]
MTRDHSPKTQRGWVSVEMAFAAVGLGLAIIFGAGLFSAGLTQIRVYEAASQIARQASRDDLAAVRQITSRLPDDAVVAINRVDNRVVVEVSIEVSPWGPALPSLVVHSAVSALAEGTAHEPV